jgi:hypothetical protein
VRYGDNGSSHQPQQPGCAVRRHKKCRMIPIIYDLAEAARIRSLLERGWKGSDRASGYDKSDPEDHLLLNSRNGVSAKTVRSEIGDVTFAIPRAHSRSAPSPRSSLAPTSAASLGGLVIRG